METIQNGSLLNPTSTMESEINLEAEKKKKFDWLLQSNYFKLPKRFKDKTLENINGMEDKVRIAKETVSRGNSLLITGSCGTGKTHLAIGLMFFKFIDSMKIVPFRGQEKLKIAGTDLAFCFMPSVELFLELKNSFGTETSELDILTWYSSYDFLVIDDLGSEKVSDWSKQIFYTLIDRRYRDMKQTIITSNLSLSQISEIIDDRISSRITEMGGVMTLSGTDWRLKNAKA